MKLKKILSVAAVCALLVACLFGTTYAAGESGDLAAADLTFSVGLTEGVQGGEVLVPITFAGNFNRLEALELTVQFDGTKLAWADFGAYSPADDATHPWIMGRAMTLIAAPGRIGASSVTFLLANIDGARAENGVLATLILRVREDAPDGEAAVSLTVGEIYDARGELNAEIYSVEAGAVVVGEAAAERTAEIYAVVADDDETVVVADDDAAVADDEAAVADDDAAVADDDAAIADDDAAIADDDAAIADDDDAAVAEDDVIADE